MFIQVQPIIDYSVRRLCYQPYPGHTHGCPNFGHKKGCPPTAPLYDQVYDLSKPVYAIYNIFEFRAHIEKMRASHPEWSDRQLKCCLYWQPKARNQLLIKLRNFMHLYPEYHIETCPEAMGVNITSTMMNAGVILEWPPENITYQIALAGIERKCRVCGCTWFHGCSCGCSWVEPDLCSACVGKE